MATESAGAAYDVWQAEALPHGKIHPTGSKVELEQFGVRCP
jgi:hypothetical protein